VRKLTAVAALLVLAGSACLGGGSGTRTVLVDYKHDEFASAFFSFFPNRVDAHPGDTIVFRQSWSGEPHSVTMGTVVDQYGQLLKPYLKIFAKRGYEGLPSEPPKKIEKVERNLPWMSDDSGNISQNGGQPCYLRTGTPPKKANTPCSDAQQRQPEFNGRYSYYNSGFVPYAGPNGDTFAVRIADNAKPGEHFFYCNYHGPFMSGFLDIKPKSAEIASSGEVAASANRQIEMVARPLLKAFRESEHGTYELDKDEAKMLEPLGLIRRSGKKTYFRGWLAGQGAEHVDTAIINEFIPKSVRAKVGEKLTWTVIGGHTISFNVPKYFPIIQTAKDGTLRLNPKIAPPAGGAPDVSKMGEEQHEGEGPPKAQTVDARSWGGRGFWSTGYLEGYDAPVVYSLRITRPGTYKFACLVHPPMVGTLTVTR
jgi:plastocyanin